MTMPGDKIDVERLAARADGYAYTHAKGSSYEELAARHRLLRDEHFARLVEADALEREKTALAAIQTVLEAEYDRCYQECCGRAGMECCGYPVQVWGKEDEHIMNTLGPVEKKLREALAAAEKEGK